MSKRSDFERIPRDAYDTPMSAVQPLLRHLPETFSYWEPCAGRGALVDHIVSNAGVSYCAATDIEPRRHDINRADALEQQPSHRTSVDFIITNPPWSRNILHPMIEHFSNMSPTWLLFDADWMHTKQSVPFLWRLHKIVSVGRVKWIPDSEMTGKDNCAWYFFSRQERQRQIEFHGRNDGQAIR